MSGKGSSASSSDSSQNFGQLQLSVRAVNETTLRVRVIKAVGLRSSLSYANSFVAAGLIPAPEGPTLKGPQTTTVVCTNSPTFNEFLNLDISRRERRSRLLISVWNKLADRKPPELIGAMSFSLKVCLTEPFSGWFYLLEESLGVSKYLKTESPENARPKLKRSESVLYENTTERHYKEPRKYPLQNPAHYQNTASAHSRESSASRSSSRSRARRSHSCRTPAPTSHPPPIPNIACSTTATADTGGRQPLLDSEYKQPSKSLYKIPAHPGGKARRVKPRSRDNSYVNLKELARFDRPMISMDTTSTSGASSYTTTSRSSYSEELSSDQDRPSFNREPGNSQNETLYARPAGGLASRNAALRRVQQQHLMNSPDSSQSSSDSARIQAALDKLNGTCVDGGHWQPIVLSVQEGANGFGFSISQSEPPIYVTAVDEGSEAERAGLKVDDRIKSVQGEQVFNADHKQVAAIIRHHRSIRMEIWRQVRRIRRQSASTRSASASTLGAASTSTKRQKPQKTESVRRTGSLRLPSKLRIDLQVSPIRSATALTSTPPTKRSAPFGKLTGSSVAKKKHKLHRTGSVRNRSKRDSVCDGASATDPMDSRQAQKALDMVTYLYNEEVEFYDSMRHSQRYHSAELESLGRLDATGALTLFQNMDLLISMSQYFSAKLEIVVRQATDGKRMIATAPEIYSPRIELVRQNYMRYMEGIKAAEEFALTLSPERNLHTPKQAGVLPLDQFLHNPLHHIQKIASAFTVLLQNIENLNTNLPQVQKICAELQMCCEVMEKSTRPTRKSRSPPSGQSTVNEPDLEMLKIQERLEFPSHLARFDLCQPNRHKLYWSDVKISGTKHKMVAWLFSDIILVARQQSGRESKLLVALDPIRLNDIIDVDYGTGANECELTLHYTAISDQKMCELSMTLVDMETKLVWKGLLRDKLARHRVADLSLSDQGIQVSESSECAEGDELCSDLVPDLSPPKSRLPDGLSDSMTAVADDLCPSSQLRNTSSNSGQGAGGDCRLHLADYTKHEAKQAMTVAVNTNNNNDSTLDGHTLSPIPYRSTSTEELCSDDLSSAAGLLAANQQSNDLFTANQQSNDIFTANQQTDDLHGTKQKSDVLFTAEPTYEESDGRLTLGNPFTTLRLPPPHVDLSAITEEGDDLTSTSMHLSCSRDETPSDFVSTPKDKSGSILSSLPSAQTTPGDSYLLMDLGVAHKDRSFLNLSNHRHHRSYSNPELYSDELASQSLSAGGYGEELCSPPSSQKITDSSAPQTTDTTPESGSRLLQMPLSRREVLTRQKSFSDDNLLNFTFESNDRRPGIASFTIGGGSPPSSTPVSPKTPLSSADYSSSRSSFILPHVESDAKLSSKSPAQRKSLSARIRRSKSYTTAGAGSTPNHARFLQQQMHQLTFDQNAAKSDGRQRKFSAVAKNVRNVLSFFKRRPSEASAPVPPLEVVESWAQNFNNLLNDKHGLVMFKNYLCSEYSEENIEFWIVCEEYKQLKPKHLPAKAQQIYSDFITPHAPKELNLDSKTRLETMKSLPAADRDLFDLAQSKIQCLMEKDSYTRFLKSSEYTSVLTQAKAQSSVSD